MKNRAERKIAAALDQAASDHRKGMDPNEAIAKAASANSLNPDMTHRVVEAFNIAKTNATIPKLSDKTASFALADSTKVMKLAFGGPLRQKSANLHESDEEPLSAGEAFREVGQTDVDLDWVGNEKVADAPEVLRDIVEQALGTIAMGTAELSKLGQDRALAEKQAFEQMRSVVDYFSTTNNLGKFAQFEAEILSQYGDGAKPTLDIIFDLAQLGHHKEARYTGAMPKLGSFHVVPTAAHKAFDGLMEKTSAFHTADEAYEKLATEVATQQSEVRSLMQESAGIVPSEAKTAADFLGLRVHKRKDLAKLEPKDDKDRAILFADKWDRENKEASAVDLIDFSSKKKIANLFALEAPANSIINSTQSGVASGVSGAHGQAQAKAIEMRHKGPTDQVNAEMDNVRRQAILQELIANDDIISKQNPQDIERNYNTLLGIAPDLTLQPSMLQAFLHSAGANQAVDPFSGKQLADMQGQLTKNKLLAAGKIGPQGQ